MIAKKGRGRPKGSKNNNVPSAVIKEWAAIYEEGDEGKALVLRRISKLGLEQDLIVERIANSHAKRGGNPELRKVLKAEVSRQVNLLQSRVGDSPVLLKLQELIPQSEVIINLSTLEVTTISRRNKKPKVKENV